MFWSLFLVKFRFQLLLGDPRTFPILSDLEQTAPIQDKNHKLKVISKNGFVFICSDYIQISIDFSYYSFRNTLFAQLIKDFGPKAFSGNFVYGSKSFYYLYICWRSTLQLLPSFLYTHIYVCILHGYLTALIHHAVCVCCLDSVDAGCVCLCLLV